MASLFNYCRFIAASGGTGPFVVSTVAPPDSNGFSHATPENCKVISGQVYKYYAVSADGTQTEYGTGVYSTATHSQARTTVLVTSESDLAYPPPVNFLTPPTVDIFPNPSLALDSINFTPVQQGGGTAQGTNKVYIGYDNAAAGVRVQVDATDFGPIYLRSGGQLTGSVNLLATGSGGIAGPVGSMLVSGTPHAAIAFLVPATFGCNLLMSTDGNFYMGGWSHGTNTFYKFFTTRDPYPLSNGRLAYAGDYAHPGFTGLAEPYGGAVHTGMSGAAFDSATQGYNSYTMRYRYMQLFTTGWFTVGYA